MRFECPFAFAAAFVVAVDGFADRAFALALGFVFAAARGLRAFAGPVVQLCRGHEAGVEEKSIVDVTARPCERRGSPAAAPCRTRRLL